MERLTAQELTARLANREAAATRGDHDLNRGMGGKQDRRSAAVLVPIIGHGDAPTVLLTRRTDHLAHHPGQISFPGGHVDAGDASHEAAALREAWEETGLEAAQVEIVGRLDRYLTRTGFDIAPVVGLVDPAFTPVADRHEVAEIFEVPLAFLIDPANHQRHARLIDGVERQYYAMAFGDYFIWGATAGMLVNLSDRLRGNGEGL